MAKDELATAGKNLETPVDRRIFPEPKNRICSGPGPGHELRLTAFHNKPRLKPSLSDLAQAPSRAMRVGHSVERRIPML